MENSPVEHHVSRARLREMTASIHAAWREHLNPSALAFDKLPDYYQDDWMDAVEHLLESGVIPPPVANDRRDTTVVEPRPEDDRRSRTCSSSFRHCIGAAYPGHPGHLPTGFYAVHAARPTVTVDGGE